jgi:heme oxygenase
MNCPCAWIEPALTNAGIHRLLPDWDQRQRRLALAADLVALEVTPDPPRTGIIEADAGTILGWTYVLEGSRLGARLLLKAVEQSEDRDVSSATRFLRQGVGTDLWGSFKAVLSEIDHDTDAIAKACAAAILAFECFKDALIRLPNGRDACESGACRKDSAPHQRVGKTTSVARSPSARSAAAQEAILVAIAGGDQRA